jgi:hypothetical protein
MAYGRKVKPLDWDEIDIDRSQDLILQYDHKVPVLCLDDEEVCHHFLDVRALSTAIANIG